MMHTDNILRPLSIQEASFPIYAQLSPGAGNILAAITLETEFTVEQVQRAILRLHQSETLLRASYVYLPGEKAYVFVEVNDELPVLEHAQADSWESLASALETARVRVINCGFVPGRLLYRAMLLTAPGRSTLMVCISHAITDASAVENVLRGWINGIESPEADPPAQIPMPPALWSFMPPSLQTPVGVLRSLSVLLGLLRFQKLADRGQAFRVERPAEVHEHRCLIANRRLSTEDTTALMHRLKARNINLHGFLGAVYLLAFLQDCRARHSLPGETGELEVPLVTTVDVRRQSSDIGLRKIGCFSSGVTTPVRIPVAALEAPVAAAKQLAQGIGNGVKAALSGQEHWKILRLYPLFGYRGLRKMFLDTSEKPLGTPISFANVGMIDVRDIASPVLHYEIYGAFHVSGPGLSVNANTCNGVMTLGFTGPSPQMSQATLDAYADQVMKLLQAAAVSD